MRPVSPTLGFPLAPTLQEMQDAINEQAVPTKPVQLASVVNADLPPAADWPGCMIHVSDKNSIAISTPVAGVYTWLRADGAAL
jgi:hypothetical protein